MIKDEAKIDRLTINITELHVNYIFLPFGLFFVLLATGKQNKKIVVLVVLIKLTIVINIFSGIDFWKYEVLPWIVCEQSWKVVIMNYQLFVRDIDI